MIRTCRLLILLTILPLSLSAQWELGVKSLLRDTYNTRVYLKYNGATAQARNLEIEVGFRPKRKQTFILSKEHMLRLKPGQSYSLPFKVPLGDYVVSVDILDTNSGLHTYLEEEYSCKVSNDYFSVSDIFLSYTANKDTALMEPILRPLIQSERKNLYFFLEVYDPDYREIPVRAHLFKEKATQPSLSATNYGSRKYTSKVLYVFKDKGNRADFDDLFRIDDLSAGEYLIQILIYDDEEYLDEKSTRVVIEGKTKQQIYGDLNTSIQMMKYTISDIEIDSLLSISDPILKREKFDSEWRDQYAEEAEEQMELYFKKIFAADAQFSEDRPGWQTDRGKVFIQYGEPGQKKSGLRIQGGEYERWTYPEWSLTFLFKKRNQRYVLVE